MPRRKLGRTGEKLSILGFGGILVMDEEQNVANEMVARAFDRGINYFDVAPTYGNAEERLGPALEPYRKRCFLACKTNRRTADEAQKELENSLRTLRTDYFDLYQLHHLTTDEDIEIAFGPKGAMEVLLKAKQEGKVKFLGFSAHSEKAALAAMERFDFDTILFPINFVNWFEGNFGPRVVETARRKKMGILALKSLAHRARIEGESLAYRKVWYHPIPKEDDETARLAFNWTMMQGVTAAIPPGDPVLWDRSFRIAAAAKPLKKDEIERLRQLAKGVPPVFRA
ncbi:MAG: aldo/keto reductase [candidate division KSB1 bacterium]|nr:aldo/keto reductase [candidate division KSB1 bacterium]